MKTFNLFATALFVAGSVMAADNEEISSAAKKLAAADNYSWKTTDHDTGNSRFRPGPTEGKTEKDGYTVLAITRGDNTSRAVLKGSQGALKMEDDWQSLSDAAKDDGNGPVRFFAMMLQNF